MATKQSAVIIGHRGAKGLASENTIFSLQAALKHHVDEIEFDVRITKDNVPILHHDAALVVDNKTYQINQYTYKQLRALFDNLTTLAAALAYIDTKARPHIEVKSGEPTDPIVGVINESLRSGMYTSKDFLLASKDQRILRQLHRSLPDIEKVVIHSWSGVIATHRARQVHTKRISMRSWWLWGGFIHSMSRRGWQLSAYTLNDPAQAQKWAKAGLHGVITDYPDRFES